MWGREDVEKGDAATCPACWDEIYDNVRNDCPVCFGFGFVSTELEPDPTVFIDTDGQIAISGLDDFGLPTPDAGWVRAPRYGGFDQAYLTWLVEPDIAVDVFRINEQGVMVQTYDAEGVAPWFPILGDNDLCINVVLAPSDFTIIDSEERFQLKQVQQVTIRGFGKPGQPRGGAQRFQVAQTFQMSKAPTNSSLYQVEVDPDTPDP
jgi:hypothetical protein